MHPLNVSIAVIMVTVLSACGSVAIRPLQDKLVIAHRGASALRPEHTLAAYEKAIDDGADAIEPDLVITRDGVLVARHENELSGTTDVAARPQFADRKTIRRIDGVATSGWFVEDFTLAELQTLRARERMPEIRPASAAFDGRYPVPILQEVISLVKRKAAKLGRPIAIYPELKHPGYFRSIGLPLEQRLIDILEAHGLRGDEAPVYIQSFDVDSLKRLRRLTDVRLVQLLSDSGQPNDFQRSGALRIDTDMTTPAGLAEVGVYADGIGVPKSMVYRHSSEMHPAVSSSLVRDAHAAGLFVHAYTFRPENLFLPPALQRGETMRSSDRGDAAAEIMLFLHAGIDGFFTDDPAIGRTAADAFRRFRGNGPFRLIEGKNGDASVSD